jgi:hypothetical protein
MPSRPLTRSMACCSAELQLSRGRPFAPLRAGSKGRRYLGLAREGSRAKRVPCGVPPPLPAGLHFRRMSKRSGRVHSGPVGFSTLPVRRRNRVTSLFWRSAASFLVLGRGKVYTSLYPIQPSLHIFLRGKRSAAWWPQPKLNASTPAGYRGGM